MKSVVNYVVSRLIVPLSSQKKKKKEKKKGKDLLLHFVVRCGQSWSLISQAWLLSLQVKGWLILIVGFGV